MRVRGNAERRLEGNVGRGLAIGRWNAIESGVVPAPMPAFFRGPSGEIVTR